MGVGAVGDGPGVAVMAVVGARVGVGKGVGVVMPFCVKVMATA